MKKISWDFNYFLQRVFNIFFNSIGISNFKQLEVNIIKSFEYPGMQFDAYLGVDEAIINIDTKFMVHLKNNGKYCVMQ